MPDKVILCFGDSNTHGSKAMQSVDERKRFGRALRWPGAMAAHLGLDWSVIEEGHPGRTTVHADPIEGVHKCGLAALPVALESHRPIDLVILMLGTNDLKTRFGLPATDIAASVERLSLDILRSDAGRAGMAPQVLLVAPVPIEETGILAPIFKGGSETSRELAALYEEVAQRLGTGFVDAGKAATVDPEDGIHLDEPAHAALGKAMADAVRELLV